MLANVTTLREALRVIRSFEASSSWSFDLLGASKLPDFIATVSRSFSIAETYCTSTLTSDFASLLMIARKFVAESTYTTTAKVGVACR